MLEGRCSECGFPLTTKREWFLFGVFAGRVAIALACALPVYLSILSIVPRQVSVIVLATPGFLVPWAVGALCVNWPASSVSMRILNVVALVCCVLAAFTSIIDATGQLLKMSDATSIVVQVGTKIVAAIPLFTLWQRISSVRHAKGYVKLIAFPLIIPPLVMLADSFNFAVTVRFNLSPGRPGVGVLGPLMLYGVWLIPTLLVLRARLKYD